MHASMRARLRHPRERRRTHTHTQGSVGGAATAWDGEADGGHDKEGWGFAMRGCRYFTVKPVEECA